MTSVSSDNVDTTTAFSPNVSGASGFGSVPSGSIAQTQTAAVDPTTVTVRLLPSPGITKAFTPTSIALNTISTLTFTLTNSSTGTLTNLNFTDALSGMSVSSATIGGTCAATSSPALAVDATALNLTVPSLAASGSCTVTVSVKGTVIGVNPNTASGVTSTQTPTAGSASNTANLTVTPLAPAISKSFNPSSVLQGGTTQLTINVTNPNGVAATALTLTDDIAATTGLTGLSISSVVSDNCKSGGTVTTTSGKYTLTGGTLPAAGCAVVLNLMLPSSGTTGSVTNTIQGSSVTGTIGGQSLPTPTDASAALNVQPVADLAVTKTNGVSSVAAGSNTTYTVRVTNNGPSSVTGAVLKDPLATGLTQTGAACTSASGNTCAAAPTTTALQSAGVTLPALASGGFYELTVTASVTASSGNVTNTATIAVPSGVTDPVSTNNTASDTDSVTGLSYSISGSVFVDTNYGGGAGRPYNAAQGMTLRPGVRVELYSLAGTFISAVLTDASGAYSFANQSAGSYQVRAVNAFVTSSRTGGCTPSTVVATPPTCTQLPVQTYIYGAAAQVGGANPAGADPALSSTTLPAAAQSVASVTLSSANVTGVDFGFNFSTVVNVANAGQGSLRQFVINTNALDNSGLAQSGNRASKVTGAAEALPTARDSSIFMIPTGALTGGVAMISLSSALPAISRSNVSIDGSTQTINIGNTNAGTLGTGGTVGYLVTASLDTVQKPEVQLVGTSALAVGLDLTASNAQVRGLSIYGFGSGPNNDTYANIRIGAAASGTLVEANIIGSPATSFTCGAATTTALSNADNIRSVGGTTGTVQNNLIGCASGKGVGVQSVSVGWSILDNEIRGNGIGYAGLDGIDMEDPGSKSHTVRGNLITENGGVGVDGYSGGGSNLIERNTITGNGIAQSSSSAGETPGLRLYSANNTVKNNVIALNYGAGVMVTGGVSGNLISQNSIYDNGTVTLQNGKAASGQIGIDLLGSSDSVLVGTAPYVTKNDVGDLDSGGNDLLNFPVFNAALIVGSNLQLTGYARPGSTIEVFIAAADASGFGEGKTYLTTLTEGSAADTDTGSGSYNDPVLGSDTTNLFKFTVPLPSGVVAGTKLTATATCLTGACTGTTVTANSTSEFSYNVSVVLAQTPSVTLTKLGRNVTKNTAFIAGSGSVGVLPGETIEYCIAYQNAGGVAPNFKITDNVPAGLVALPDAYAVGKGVRFAPSTTIAAGATAAPAGSDLTNASDTDQGSLTLTGGGFGNGVMSLNLGAAGLSASGSGTVCFRTRLP